MKIEHDIHTHTHLSVCGDKSATIDYYVRSAKKLGLKKIGISDHMWDSSIAFTESMRHSRSAGDGENVLNWYRAQDIRHCGQILDEIKHTDIGEIQFFFGGEVDYCPEKGAAITVEEAEKLDFILVPNSHTHHIMDKNMYEPYQKHADFMLRAAMEICTSPTSAYITALAHPFEPVYCPYPAEYVFDKLKDMQLEEVFCAAKEANIAAEINTVCFAGLDDGQIGNHRMLRILKIAKNCGCKFTFGSDSHADGEEDTILLGEKVADLLGLTEEDLHDFVKPHT